MEFHSIFAVTCSRPKPVPGGVIRENTGRMELASLDTPERNISGGSARSRLRQPSFGRAAETSLIQTCLPRRRRARGNSSTCVVTRITRAKCVRRYNHDARHRGPNKAGDAMRIFLFAAALALLPLPAGAVDGFNMPGDDYANFPAGSAFVCRNTCGGESRCQGWTWVKPGLQGPAGHCWLKSSIPLPPLVKDDCCSSGSHENIDARDLTAENRTNRWGSDYTNFDSDGWESCQAACAGQDRCASWSYVQPGVQGPSGRCWLKTIVARPSDDANVISGVKFRPRAGKFD